MYEVISNDIYQDYSASHIPLPGLIEKILGSTQLEVVMKLREPLSGG